MLVPIAKNGAPRREGAPPAHKCAPRGVGAPLASNKFHLLLITVPFALRGAPPARKRAHKASGSDPPVYNMLSLTCRAPLARQAPTVS